MKDSVRRPSRVTSRVRALVWRGEASAAVDLAFAELGAEVFGFLIGVVGDVDRARMLYAEVRRRAEGAMPSFGWECSVRVWAYGLARAELRARRRRRSSSARSSAPAGKVIPLPASRPRLPRAVASMRAALPEEDREILILRLDRALEWKDVARTGLGAAADDSAIDAEVQRLRGRLAAIQRDIRLSLRRQRERSR